MHVYYTSKIYMGMSKPIKHSIHNLHTYSTHLYNFALFSRTQKALHTLKSSLFVCCPVTFRCMGRITLEGDKSRERLSFLSCSLFSDTQHVTYNALHDSFDFSFSLTIRIHMYTQIIYILLLIVL